MPDTHHPYSWSQFARDFLMFLQVVALAYIARTSNTVETNQAEVRQTLEVKAEADAKATRVQLWNAWRNLEWIAEESGLPKDRVKADEARKVYDDWKRLENGE